MHAPKILFLLSIKYKYSLSIPSDLEVLIIKQFFLHSFSTFLFKIFLDLSRFMFKDIISNFLTSLERVEFF